MTFTPVEPGDAAAVAISADLSNAASAVDDPHELPSLPESMALDLTYGWDLEPSHLWLYTPDGADAPVGMLQTSASERDNRHAMNVGVVVHPAHRRHGHGTAILTEGLRRAAEAGRTTIWAGAHDGDTAATALAARFGFTLATREARRTQNLTAIDGAAVDRLFAEATHRAGDYIVERRQGLPTPDELLADLVAVTESINDAPMGELSWEREVFDLQRLRDFETAQAGRRNRLYRIFARHKGSGEIGGHTIVAVNDFWPARAWQLDTAVHHDHRGHRLGALLKITMMRWIAEAEPTVREIDTWNNADNDYMISINEQIGYRLTGLFTEWELRAPRSNRPTRLRS